MKIDCKNCTGLEQNSTCIIIECIKPSVTSAVTDCEQLGRECSEIVHVVTCKQDDVKPKGVPDKLTCIPKVDDCKGRGRNKVKDNDDDDDDGDDDDKKKKRCRKN